MVVSPTTPFPSQTSQSHLLPEKTLKDLLTQLTRPVVTDDEDEEEEDYDKPSRRGKRKEQQEQEGLVKYLPLAQQEAVQALVEAAAGGGKRGGVRKRMCLCVCGGWPRPLASLPLDSSCLC